MPEEFLVEDKFDGIRAQAHVEKGRVAIYSRTMDEITHRFPELIEPLRSLPTDVIIDGEIVPANGDVILPFSELQKRTGPEERRHSVAARRFRWCWWPTIFYAGGKVLIDQPLERAQTSTGPDCPIEGPLRMSQGKLLREAAMLDEEFDLARARGNEGLMIKSPVRPISLGDVGAIG
jgi:DNA ligase-1